MSALGRLQPECEDTCCRVQVVWLAERKRGGGIKVWVTELHDTPQFLTRRKKPPFENNQTLGRANVCGSCDSETPSQMTVLL